MARLARDLGYTLAELAQKITPEELDIWALVYAYEYQQQEQAMKKARRR